MNKMAFTLVILLLAIFTSNDNPGFQAQTGLRSELCSQYNQANSELNKVYQQILREYGKDALFIQKLKAAQRAWLIFRDAHVESLYPEKDKLSAYGTVYRDCFCQSMAELTSKRTEQLRRWIEGWKEGEVCAGSVKIKN
jgi:uncharacterized protein YecT (DUF1311 family)